MSEILNKILRRTQVLAMLGVSCSTMADWENPKSKRYRPDFPKKNLTRG